MERRLTIKETRLAHEYVANGGDVRAAYRLAYDTSGAPATQRVLAHRVRTRPRVAKLIEDIQREAFAATDLTAAELIVHTKNIAETAPDRRTRLDALRLLGTWAGLDQGSMAIPAPVPSVASAIDQAILAAMGAQLLLSLAAQAVAMTAFS